ncbi:amidohydrolase [Asticcacaulis solisilvae]|uniref:amidohydrolase n=1 Tax=Asticcacaulis solisilvae TaxID=1217274 RepID=UPI003FD84CA1
MVALLISACLAIGSSAEAKDRRADTVFVNGTIYTGDANGTVAEALALRGGVITYVGANVGAKTAIGRKTLVIDLKGRMVMAGLIDGHMHPQSGGLRMLDCNLNYEALTVAQFQARIQACVDADTKAGPDDWLNVINWFEQNMQPAGTVLDHTALDGVRTTRPIRVHSSYGHTDLVNARALSLAHITRDTPDPKDGVIVRFADGSPTGLLEDAAKDLVTNLMPQPSLEKNYQATQKALAVMRAQGITTFLDAYTDIDTLTTYRKVQAEGSLTARAHFAVLIDSVPNYDPDSAIAEVLREKAQFDQGPLSPAPSMQLRTAKLFLDGVYGAPSLTGIMIDPYFENRGTAEKPDWRPGTNHGVRPYFTQEQLDTTLIKLAAAGLDAHMHADSDGAVREALNAIEAMRKVHPGEDIRPAVAHDEIVAPEDFHRFAELHALPVLSFQWEKPAVDLNAANSGYLGPIRWALMEPAGFLKLYGARIVFGSDWPVDPLDEWLAMQVAVTRSAVGEDAQKYPGRLGIDPGLSVADAIRAMTLDAAYSLHQDTVTGSLEAGKYADLIVLDRNLFQVPATDIAGTRVLMTMVGGKIVYSDGSLTVSARKKAGL